LTKTSSCQDGIRLQFVLTHYSKCIARFHGYPPNDPHCTHRLQCGCIMARITPTQAEFDYLINPFQYALNRFRWVIIKSEVPAMGEDEGDEEEPNEAYKI